MNISNLFYIVAQGLLNLVTNTEFSIATNILYVILHSNGNSWLIGFFNELCVIQLSIKNFTGVPVY